MKRIGPVTLKWLHLASAGGVLVSLAMLLRDCRVHHLATAYESPWFITEFVFVVCALIIKMMRDDSKGE